MILRLCALHWTKSGYFLTKLDYSYNTVAHISDY